MPPEITIREILPEEIDNFGQFLTAAYSQLKGFPSREDHPDYYHSLRNIGIFTEQKDSSVLVALSANGELLGGVVCIGDMAEYGAIGAAIQEKDASGIRFLWVDSVARNRGVGKALTHACIDQARDRGQSQVILHTMQAMQIAWGLYDRMGFKRSQDLDFNHDGVPVYGFRLSL